MSSNSTTTWHAACMNVDTMHLPNHTAFSITVSQLTTTVCMQQIEQKIHHACMNYMQAHNTNWGYK